MSHKCATVDIFDEELDDHDVISKFFHRLDTSCDGLVSTDEILAALAKFEDCSPISLGLTTLLENVSRSGRDSFDLQAFTQLVHQIPRLHGQRVQWARALRLECILARHLATGPLFNELAGVRAMTASSGAPASMAICSSMGT